MPRNPPRGFWLLLHRLGKAATFLAFLAFALIILWSIAAVLWSLFIP